MPMTSETGQNELGGPEWQCIPCYGTGLKIPDCGECHGTGRSQNPDLGFWGCPTCGMAQCDECKGTGERPKS